MKFLEVLRVCADGLELYDQSSRLVRSVKEVKEAGKRSVELYKTVRDAARRAKEETGERR
jgi:hypothetical protein